MINAFGKGLESTLHKIHLMTSWIAVLTAQTGSLGVT